MKRLIFFAFILFSFQNLLAQQIEFKIQLQGKNLELDKEYTLDKQSFTVSTCKFYISYYALIWQHPLVNYRLIDLSDKQSLIVHIPGAKKSLSHFNFTLGVDSTKNESGVFGGDLDPTNGMYWTWQSGYINVKLEGTAPHCPARKNKFQLHLGGYAHPFNTSRSISYRIDKKNDNYTVYLKLDSFFDTVDLSKEYQVMSPNKKAMKLSDLFASCFATDDE